MTERVAGETLSRFVPRRSIGRLADEVADIHERLARVAPSVDVPARLGRDVTTLVAINELLSPRGSAGSDIISPPAPEAFLIEQEIPEFKTELADPVTTEVQSTLSEVEDLRRFSFSQAEPLRRQSGGVVRLLAAKPTTGSLALPHGVAAEQKADVIMCIRRKARRGVILALGQGGGYHRPPRRSPKSDIWC